MTTLHRRSNVSGKPIRTSTCCWEHIACVKTVSEPLELVVTEICLERKADSPSYCFFEEVVRKRRAFRAGFRAPKAGALPGCATPRHYWQN